MEGARLQPDIIAVISIACVIVFNFALWGTTWWIKKKNARKALYRKRQYQQAQDSAIEIQDLDVVAGGVGDEAHYLQVDASSIESSRFANSGFSNTAILPIIKINSA